MASFGGAQRAPGDRCGRSRDVRSLVVLVLAFGADRRWCGQRVLSALFARAPMMLRRWPLPVLAVAVGATGVEIASGNASIPLGVMLGLATYLASSSLQGSIAMPRSRRRPHLLGVTRCEGAACCRGIGFGHGDVTDLQGLDRRAINRRRATLNWVLCASPNSSTVVLIAPLPL